MFLKLPQYSGKDYLVMTSILLPFTLVMNYALFGGNYFRPSPYFLPATAITAVAFCLDFTVCGLLAVRIKQRFPSEDQLSRRLAVMIISFLIMTGLFLIILFRGYESLGFYEYSFDPGGFVWAYFGMGMGNIFLTFFMEGISRYQSWKQNMKETDELKKSYHQSQLLGLKSQVNPHFLFNSLNSLSSLINEDETKAERFLDEMSKVYRYMLRNDDDQLVTLDAELKFIESYLFLLRTRYGSGLQASIDISGDARSLLLPPLSLQVIIENALNQNTTSKQNPLIISVETEGDQRLIIRNSLQPKVLSGAFDLETGLDNLRNKYLLLNKPDVIIRDEANERIIQLPLISNEEEVVS